MDTPKKSPYRQVQYWATGAIGCSFFTLGCTTTIVPSILVYLMPQIFPDTSYTEHRLQLIFLYLLLALGHILGTIMATLVVENIPSAIFLFNGLALLLLGIGFALLPIFNVYWNFLLLFFVVGFLSAWIDVSGNALILKFFRRKAANYVQVTHLCFGIGASLAPVGLYYVKSYTGFYNWTSWGITIISCLSTVANLSNIFTHLPTPRKQKQSKIVTVLDHATKFTGARSSPSGSINIDLTTDMSSYVLLSGGRSYKDGRTPLLSRIADERIIRKYGYLTVVSSYARSVIVFFTSAFLFLFAGLHGSFSFWLCIWLFTYVDTNAFFMLAEYWLGFTISSLFLDRIKLQWTVSNFFILIGDLIGGTLVSSLLALTVLSGKVVLRDHTIWLWVCVPLLGIFNAGIFPAAISIPNDNSLWVRKSDKHWLTLGHSLGLLGAPIVVGFLFYWEITMGIIWTTFAAYAVGILVFLSTLSFCMFSRDMAEITQLATENTFWV